MNGMKSSRLGVVVTLMLMLAGCATPGPHIDTRYESLNHDSRVRYVILHFTQLDFERSLEVLSRGRVSSHYLVSLDPVRSYRLVDEQRRAWHAGQSYWRGDTTLNSSSIGIEIVNLGPDGDPGVPFMPFPDRQIDEVIRLVRDIARRHGVAAHRILGHSDIAPQRKVDPGPQFPWRRLFEAGLVPWPDEVRVAEQRITFEKTLPDIAWFQTQLADYGFEVQRHGQLDESTRRVLANFQAKYRPSRYDGEPDAETAALLATLNQPDGRVIRRADGSIERYLVMPYRSTTSSTISPISLR